MDEKKKCIVCGNLGTPWDTMDPWQTESGYVWSHRGECTKKVTTEDLQRAER